MAARLVCLRHGPESLPNNVTFGYTRRLDYAALPAGKRRVHPPYAVV
ncbi:hypothetical protein N9250_01480 [bacterium]|nr:hypothetical protein [bacterium]